MRITGTMVYQDLEGGFWGLAGDDGQQYEPVDALPDSVLTEGCRVRADVEPVDVISFRQWGRPVRVRHVARI